MSIYRTTTAVVVLAAAGLLATISTDEGATMSKTPINAGEGATLLELKAWT
jgi:hypothetical protein